MPNGNALRISCAILLLLVSGSCQKSVPQLSAESVRAGGSVRLTLPAGHGADEARLTATIGGRAVPVRVQDSEILIALPLSDPGPAELKILSGERVLFSREITVLEAPARWLELSIGPKGVELVQATRSADALTTDTPTRETRLSFDVLNARGGLVQTGSIPHPANDGGEIFEPTGAPGMASARRLDPRAVTRFFINIVNPSEGWRLQIYEAPAGLDLGTGEGRAQRVLLKEMEL